MVSNCRGCRGEPLSCECGFLAGYTGLTPGPLELMLADVSVYNVCNMRCFYTNYLVGISKPLTWCVHVFLHCVHVAGIVL